MMSIRAVEFAEREQHLSGRFYIAVRVRETSDRGFRVCQVRKV